MVEYIFLFFFFFRLASFFLIYCLPKDKKDHLNNINKYFNKYFELYKIKWTSNIQFLIQHVLVIKKINVTYLVDDQRPHHHGKVYSSRLCHNEYIRACICACNAYIRSLPLQCFCFLHLTQ